MLSLQPLPDGRDQRVSPMLDISLLGFFTCPKVEMELTLYMFTISLNILTRAILVVDPFSQVYSKGCLKLSFAYTITPKNLMADLKGMI